jgi:hypothetical protein
VFRLWVVCNIIKARFEDGIFWLGYEASSYIMFGVELVSYWILLSVLYALVVVSWLFENCNRTHVGALQGSCSESERVVSNESSNAHRPNHKHRSQDPTDGERKMRGQTVGSEARIVNMPTIVLTFEVTTCRVGRSCLHYTMGSSNVVIVESSDLLAEPVVGFRQ